MPATAASFLRGAGYPLRGLSLLAREQRLWPYAVLPAVIQLAVLLGLGAAALLLLDDAFAWLRPAAVAPGAGALAQAGHLALVALAAVGALALVLLGAIVGTVLIAAVLAGPFQEKLSEVTEAVVRGAAPPAGPSRLADLARDTGRAIRSALGLVALSAAIYLPLLALSLVPIVGLVASLMLLAYTAVALALNFLGPTLDRRRLSLGQRLGWLRRRPALLLGFGAATALLLLVPLVNLFLAPVLVVGAALLFLEEEASGTGPPGEPAMLAGPERRS